MQLLKIKKGYNEITKQLLFFFLFLGVGGRSP